jgi:ElaB/YqjD/DUF883 family membrane-anchored ribosome-binding protein
MLTSASTRLDLSRLRRPCNHDSVDFHIGFLVPFPPNAYLLQKEEQLEMAQKTQIRSKSISETADSTREKVGNMGKHARATADRSVKKSREAIQERPLTAVGVGVAAGAAVGLIAAALIARKRTDKKDLSRKK